MKSSRNKPKTEQRSPGIVEGLQVSGPGGIRRLYLSSSRLVIGRAPDCPVHLDDPAVSRHHTELFRDPFGRWWVHDLGSRNGTRVNGVSVVERVLAPGDPVEIGPFALTVLGATGEETMAPAAGKKVPVSEGDFEKISTETDVEVPRLAASHISKLIAFGRELLSLAGAEERLRRLCDLMVSSELCGRMVMVMRLEKGRPEEPPLMLCEPVATAGPDGIGVRPYVSRSMLRALRERGEPVLGSNVTHRGGIDLTISKDEMPMSAVACPLRSDERTMDVLYVLLPPEFGTNEWLALASLASEEFQKAETAWATRRQAQTNAVVEHELEQAREIQMRLIPKDVTVQGLDLAIGFEPCRWVGGDTVDVIPMEDGRVLLTVGDVCGKGMQAALVASEVHSHLHASLHSNLALCELMKRLNTHLCKYLPAHSFVTMACVAIDPRTGEMEVFNAGHPPAMVFDRSGRARRLQEGANTPLGLPCDSFECARERLGNDELLAMVTDGLFESRDPASETAGLEHLAEGLGRLYAGEHAPNAGDVAERLNAELRKALGAHMAWDDRSFLLVRRTT